MRKIVNLNRLDLPNAVKMITYLLKRGLRLAPNSDERDLNAYYDRLISNDGILKAESGNYFVSFFSKWNVKIKTRKRPSSDIDVFNQVFSQAEYEPLVKAFSEHFDNGGKLDIIDAGANIGLTSLYLSRHFRDARFICIEPDVANCAVLKFNLAENKVKNPDVLNAGLWPRNAHLELVSDFRDKRDWSIRVRETQNNSGLQAFSIQHVMREFKLDKIDILKIDIEGSEKEVFTSPNADISFLAVTKCIALEIHDEFDCRAAIYNALAQYGFTYFNSGELTIGVNQNLL